MTKFSLAYACVTLVVVAAAPALLASGSACETGGFGLDSASTQASRPARFSAWDGLGYCSGLTHDSSSVVGDEVELRLVASDGGPAACGGGSVAGQLPLLVPGRYNVTANLTVGGQPLCVLGSESLDVSAAASSMLDNSDFERGLDAWSASAGWSVEDGVVRSDGGFRQFSQCVPVAPGERYTVSVSARGDGSSAGIGVGVWSYFGGCPGLPVDPTGTGTIQSVGGLEFEDVELEYVSPTPPGIGTQVYAGVTIFDEATGAALLVDSVTMRRPDCPASAEVACLHGGRFEARLAWRAFDQNTGSGRIVSEVNDSSLWWFFAPTNWEMVVKVLRGCSLGRHWWVFAAGATNVEWDLTVDDSSTGVSWSHHNDLGERSPAVTDTAAIACAASE